jgi:hypothetical protein
MKPSPMFCLAASLVLGGAALAADKAPDRKVEGTTVSSSHDPALKITLPATAQYVGSDRWNLYDFADAEVHVFVEADAQKRIQRVYWLQFEGFLPDNTHTYKYPFTEKLTHDGLEFDVKARFGPTNQPPKPGSDLERVLSLLGKGGYQMPAESMNVRLVYLPDEAKRKELMIIYAEDLAPAGTTSAQLDAPEGKAKWDELKKELIERALERIELK